MSLIHNKTDKSYINTKCGLREMLQIFYKLSDILIENSVHKFKKRAYKIFKIQDWVPSRCLLISRGWMGFEELLMLIRDGSKSSMI